MKRFKSTVILFLFALTVTLSGLSGSSVSRNPAVAQFQQLSHHYYSVAYMFLFYGELEAFSYFMGKHDAYEEAIAYLIWLDHSQVSAERPATGELLHQDARARD